MEVQHAREVYKEQEGSVEKPWILMALVTRGCLFGIDVQWLNAFLEGVNHLSENGRGVDKKYFK